MYGFLYVHMYIYSMNNTSIQQLAIRLKACKKTIVTAESITAGRFAALLTSVPGASSYFL